MSAASGITTNSVEKFLKQAKIDKMRTMSIEYINKEAKIKAEPARVSEKKRLFLEK